MKYLILIISFFLSFNFVLASKPSETANDFYEQIDDKIISPVKQNFDKIPEKAQSGFSKFMEGFQNRFQEEKEEFKEDIKEEIKEEVKEQSEKKIRWAEGTIKSWLSPLKIRIEQGSRVIKGWMSKGIDWIKSL